MLETKEGFRLDVREAFHSESSEALAQLPRELWCPIPGGAQGQVGWALGSRAGGGNQPMAGVGTGWAVRSLPTQTIL